MRLGYPVVSRHVSMAPVGARRGVLPPGAREEGHPHPAAAPRQHCPCGVLLVRVPFHRRDETSPPTFFRIALPAAEVARLKDIRLLPGMPAEVFIQTHERTPLQ